MLTRSGRGSCVKVDQYAAENTNQLALLQAGRRRPVIQALYPAKGAGLGRAMDTAGEDSSDLDSGVNPPPIPKWLDQEFG